MTDRYPPFALDQGPTEPVDVEAADGCRRAVVMASASALRSDDDSSIWRLCNTLLHAPGMADACR